MNRPLQKSDWLDSANGDKEAAERYRKLAVLCPGMRGDYLQRAKRSDDLAEVKMRVVKGWK